MGFSCSAPCKAILFGEHYVVYGAPAVSIPIEPRNEVVFSNSCQKGICLKSSLGEAQIISKNEYHGPESLRAFSEVAAAVFGSRPFPSALAEFLPAWKLKGVGLSASLCAAFSVGLYKLKGGKPSTQEIFLSAQRGDLLAHGRKASGIDAKTVVVGKPLVFKKEFSPAKMIAKAVSLRLPKGCSLALVDTNTGKKDGTQKMLSVFAKQFGITALPSQISEEKRAEVRAEYLFLWKEILKVLKKPSALSLGKLMNENHLLLKKRGVSANGIERAVSSALSNGAYGAKLTGGGGEGGAVLVLCENAEEEKILEKIREETGFSCYHIEIAKKGACVD